MTEPRDVTPQELRDAVGHRHDSTGEYTTNAFPDDTVENLFSDAGANHSEPSTHSAVGESSHEQMSDTVQSHSSDEDTGERPFDQYEHGLDDLDAVNVFSIRSSDVLQVPDIKSLQASICDGSRPVAIADPFRDDGPLSPRESVIITDVTSFDDKSIHGTPDVEVDESSGRGRSGSTYEFGHRWGSEDFTEDDESVGDTREAEEKIFEDALREYEMENQIDLDSIEGADLNHVSVSIRAEQSDTASLIENIPANEHRSPRRLASSTDEDAQLTSTAYPASSEMASSFAPLHRVTAAKDAAWDVSSLTALIKLIRERMAVDEQSLSSQDDFQTAQTNNTTATYHTGISAASRPATGQRMASTRSDGTTLSMLSDSILRAFGGTPAKPPSTLTQRSYTDAPKVEDLAHIDRKRPIDDSLETDLALKTLLVHAIFDLHSMPRDKSTLLAINACISRVIDLAIRQNISVAARGRVAFYMGVCRLLQSKTGATTDEAVQWFRFASKAKGIYSEGARAERFIQGLTQGWVE